MVSYNFSLGEIFFEQKSVGAIQESPLQKEMCLALSQILTLSFCAAIFLRLVLLSYPEDLEVAKSLVPLELTQ